MATAWKEKKKKEKKRPSPRTEPCWHRSTPQTSVGRQRLVDRPFYLWVVFTRLGADPSSYLHVLVRRQSVLAEHCHRRVLFFSLLLLLAPIGCPLLGSGGLAGFRGFSFSPVSASAGQSTRTAASRASAPCFHPPPLLFECAGQDRWNRARMDPTGTLSVSRGVAEGPLSGLPVFLATAETLRSRRAATGGRSRLALRVEQLFALCRRGPSGHGVILAILVSKQDGPDSGGGWCAVGGWTTLRFTCV